MLDELSSLDAGPLEVVLPLRMPLRLLRIVALLPLLAVPETRSGDIRFAGMRLGTSWYVFSATLYKLMAEEMPPGTRLEVLAKGGGIANPLLVDRGKADVALANRATAVWARDGHPLVYGGRKHEGLCVLVGGLNKVPVSVLVREDYLKRTGYKSLPEIFSGENPVRVVMKPKGSSVPVVADLILDALGTSRDAIRRNGGRIIQVSAKQIPDVMRNGQADVYFEAMPKGHPGVTQVSLTVPVRFFGLPEKVLARLARIGLETMEIPAGTWKGQAGAFKAVDLGTVILTHQRLPDRVAYLFTKTICEEREALARAHKAWSGFDPEQAWRPENCGIALHPASERYYRERGWIGEDRDE
jgi:TRAP transporter TAXI family solute receptor